MLKFLLPDEVKVNIANHDIRLKSNLITNRTNKFTKKCFFYTVLGFVESHSGVLGDIDGFIQLIPGGYKNVKPINITGVDKVHLKCDCIIGSFVNSIREPILYSFYLSSPPSHNLFKEPRTKIFEKKNKSVPSHTSFCFQDDGYKAVDFNGETVSFICQLMKV